MSEQLFIDLCANGDLEEAKQYLLNNPNINISVLAFRYACANNHVEVCKWLLQICPDILLGTYY